MIEVTGNLWTYPADIRIITTNGYVKQNGNAVMGRGCAYEATLKYPRLPLELGLRIRNNGNRVFCFNEYNLITFPVKYNWNEDANLELIKQSTSFLLGFILERYEYVMPRAGCGNGRLKWEDVKPILSVLPDNVKVITFE